VIRRVERLPRARIDLAEIFSYIANDNLPAAERFVEAAEDAFAKLADMPGMGPEWGSKKRSLRGVRFWPIKGFTNYLIFYRRLEDGVRILRVIHGARNIEKVFDD
jgi:toxin ParE1/3/4